MVPVRGGHRATAVHDAALFGGPWISIEAPVNPVRQTVRGALLLVHTFHHGTKVNMPLSGKAEGLVDGRRGSVDLKFVKSSADRHARRAQRVGEQGNLDGARDGERRNGGSIQAVVDIDADGAVGRVQRAVDGDDRTLSAAEIDRGLRERARVTDGRGRA